MKLLDKNKTTHRTKSLSQTAARDGCGTPAGAREGGSHAESQWVSLKGLCHEPLSSTRSSCERCRGRGTGKVQLRKQTGSGGRVQGGGHPGEEDSAGGGRASVREVSEDKVALGNQGSGIPIPVMLGPPRAGRWASPGPASCGTSPRGLEPASSTQRALKGHFHTFDAVSIKHKRYIPVHVVKLMDGIDGQHHFTDIESCHIFWKLVFKFTEQGQ